MMQNNFYEAGFRTLWHLPLRRTLVQFVFHGNFYRAAVIMILLYISTGAFGQRQGIKYTASLQSEIIMGATDVTGGFFSSHGIKFKQWSAAIGAGVDFYRYRTVPVFFDIKKSFHAKGKAQPFVQAIAGVNIAHPTDGDKIRQNGYWLGFWPPASDTFHFNNGFYAKLGAGLILNPRQKLNININAGISYKSVTESYTEWVYNGSSAQREKHINIYRLSRFYFGVGIGL